VLLLLAFKTGRRDMMIWKLVMAAAVAAGTMGASGAEAGARPGGY